MLSVALIAFAMFRFVGDPVNQIVAIDTPPAQARRDPARRLGSTTPSSCSSRATSINAAQLEFGVSYQFRLPVSALLGERMPATLELAFCAGAVLAGVGILMGIYTALRRDSFFAKLLQAVSLIGISCRPS
jgi:peptide/nickel transport system permease protein